MCGFTAVGMRAAHPGDIKDALRPGGDVERRARVFSDPMRSVQLGRVGEPAVPHLIDLLKDSDAFPRSNAVVSLMTVGPPAIKAVPLISDLALQEANLNTRRTCVLAVGAIEPDKLTDLFARVRKHNDEKVRSVAYQAVSSRFGKKGPVSSLPATVAVPLLIEGVKDGSANVRLVVVQGLQNLGPDAKDAAPALTKLLEDPDMRVRTQAQVALNVIKGK